MKLSSCIYILECPDIHDEISLFWKMEFTSLISFIRNNERYKLILIIYYFIRTYR